MRKSLLVSKQITYTRVQAKSIVSFSFEKQKATCSIWDPRACQSERENANKSAFTQANACIQKQAVNVNAAVDCNNLYFMNKTELKLN